MIDEYTKTVAEEYIDQKVKTQKQRRRKLADRIKQEIAKDRIRVPRSSTIPIDLSRIKRISDLPEE